MKREFGSHLNASILNWSFAAGYGEVMAVLHTSAFVNANRDEKTHPEPVVFPTPWAGENEADEQVSPEERERLMRLLASRSAFAS